MQSSRPHPDLLIQSLCLNQLPRWDLFAQKSTALQQAIISMERCVHLGAHTKSSIGCAKKFYDFYF